MSSLKINLALFLVSLTGVIFLDRLAKYLISFLHDKPITLGHTAFQFVYRENPQAAFSIPISGFPLIIIVSLLILGFIYFTWRYLDWMKPLTALVSAFILGGALSNLADRIFFGHVIDFIKIWFYPVFNFADVFIFLGVLGLIIFYRPLSKKS